MTTLTQLPQSYLPWRFALRVERIDSDTFSWFIAALKAAFPPRERKWDADNKCWLLRDCDVAIGLLEQFNIAYECDTAQDAGGTAHRKTLTTAEAYRLLFLQPDAPDFIVNAAYRAMAKHYHPDAGGDTATMQRINAALEVLR